MPSRAVSSSTGRAGAPRAQPAQQLEAVDVRQADVEQQRDRTSERCSSASAASPEANTSTGQAGAAEDAGEAVRQHPVVLDQKNARAQGNGPFSGLVPGSPGAPNILDLCRFSRFNRTPLQREHGGRTCPCQQHAPRASTQASPATPRFRPARGFAAAVSVPRFVSPVRSP